MAVVSTPYPHDSPWREHPFANDLLHDGGRWGAAAMLVLLVVDGLRPRTLNRSGARCPTYCIGSRA